MVTIVPLKEEDIESIKLFVKEGKNKNFVKNRIDKNINNALKNISKEEFWKSMICCLLTTQQKSGPESAVTRFIRSTPFSLDYDICLAAPDLKKYTESRLSEFGGLRRGKTIAREVFENLEWLEKKYGWQQIFDGLMPLFNGVTKFEERKCAEMINDTLLGFGPKQSRNLLQLLGLTKYEIPIDSRITKWLENYGLQIKSPSTLSNKRYYNQISNFIQSICENIGEYPCVLDAVIFSSYDVEWDEKKLIW